MRNPNPDMLLRIAQADAYAAATEYIKLPRDQGVYGEALLFQRYCEHPRHLLRAGQYTDDAQMSVAVAEVLVEGRPYTKERFADAFVRCFHRDKRDGYARGFQALLESVHSGAELLAKVRPDSDKNGAAMRSVPLGAIHDPKEVVLCAQIQAAITHDTPDGILSSQVVALLSHFALYLDNPLETGATLAFLAAYLPPKSLAHVAQFLVPWSGPVASPSVGMKTVHAVFTLVTSGKSLMEVLRQTIEWGGDTDSVAAIAWGILSTRDRDSVPDFLEHCLEPGGLYGVPFLKDLGQRLMRL